MGLFRRQIAAFAVAITISPGAFAADDITLNLESVRLYDLVKIAYGEQGAGFVVDADLINDSHFYSLDLKSLTNDKLRGLVDDMLADRGYQIQKKSGYSAIHKMEKGKIEKIPFIYRPKYRPVSYLADMVNGVFDTGRFTFQQGKAQAPGGTKDGVSSALDSGTSAYSNIQRPQDSFIFYGTEQEVDLLAAFMQQLDVPSGEILVKAYLYEVTNTKSEGSAFNAALEIISGKLGVTLDGADFANSINLTLPNVKAVFSAFGSDNRFKIISSPSVRVKDGASANFTVGAEVPILGNITTQQGTSTQSVEYKSSGTILDIKPTIRAEAIELDIRQQVSNFIRTSTGVDSSPTLIKRELSSTIVTKHGDLILIGGLDESTGTDDSSGLSWLPRFLKTNTSDNSKTDILLVLHVTKI